MSRCNTIIGISHLLWKKRDALRGFWGGMWHNLTYIVMGWFENRLYADKGGIRETSWESVTIISARDDGAWNQGRSDGDGD